MPRTSIERARKRNKGEYEQAETLFREAIAIRMNASGPDSDTNSDTNTSTKADTDIETKTDIKTDTNAKHLSTFPRAGPAALTI